MIDPTTIDAARVRLLAEYADLPLAPGREQAIAPTLGVWLADANELSRKMSETAWRGITPATVFAHPGADDPER